jgi:peptide/nickel transport system permease protein
VVPGARHRQADDFWDQARRLVLPSLALALGWIGFIARLVRSSMLEVLGENYIRTARAYGLPERLSSTNTR